jgi:hypothetical protein
VTKATKNKRKRTEMLREVARISEASSKLLGKTRDNADQIVRLLKAGLDDADDAGDADDVSVSKEALLRQLVVEICGHYDPMFGHINLHRLDDQLWMSRAREALGEETWLEMFPWWVSFREEAGKKK